MILAVGDGTLNHRPEISTYLRNHINSPSPQTVTRRALSTFLFLFLKLMLSLHILTPVALSHLELGFSRSRIYKDLSVLAPSRYSFNKDLKGTAGLIRDPPAPVPPLLSRHIHSHVRNKEENREGGVWKGRR